MYPKSGLIHLADNRNKSVVIMSVIEDESNNIILITSGLGTQ